jgi:hypothetical protein
MLLANQGTSPVPRPITAVKLKGMCARRRAATTAGLAGRERSVRGVHTCARQRVVQTAGTRTKWPPPHQAVRDDVVRGTPTCARARTPSSLLDADLARGRRGRG